MKTLKTKRDVLYAILEGKTVQIMMNRKWVDLDESGYKFTPDLLDYDLTGKELFRVKPTRRILNGYILPECLTYKQIKELDSERGFYIVNNGDEWHTCVEIFYDETIDDVIKTHADNGLIYYNKADALKHREIICSGFFDTYGRFKPGQQLVRNKDAIEAVLQGLPIRRILHNQQYKDVEDLTPYLSNPMNLIYTDLEVGPKTRMFNGTELHEPIYTKRDLNEYDVVYIVSLGRGEPVQAIKSSLISDHLLECGFVYANGNFAKRHHDALISYEYEE